MREGQHFWEVKMITPVYGTNMVGYRANKNVQVAFASYDFLVWMSVPNDLVVAAQLYAVGCRWLALEPRIST